MLDRNTTETFYNGARRKPSTIYLIDITAVSYSKEMIADF